MRSGCFVFAVGPYAAAIGYNNLGFDGGAHGIGNQIADCRLLTADRGTPAVERGRRHADLAKPVDISGNERDRRVRLRRRGIDEAKPLRNGAVDLYELSCS